MVCGKEKIIATILGIFLLLLPVYPQKKHVVNWGVKGGFNSTMNIVETINVDGTTVNDYGYRNKLGYTIALFERFNIKRHFIQIGQEFVITNSEITFDKKFSQHPDIAPEYATAHSNIKSIGVPVVYGYDIVSKRPFGFSAFAGISMKYILANRSQTTFHDFNEEKLSENLAPFTLTALVGLGVNISHVFFDFSYEIGLRNISQSIKTTDSTANVLLRRRNNTLNVTVGCMF